MKKKKKKRIFPYTIDGRYNKKKRSDIITRKMLGSKYSIHNGRHYVVVVATSARLGTRIGDYAPTRVFGKYPKKKMKGKKK